MTQPLVLDEDSSTPSSKPPTSVGQNGKKFFIEVFSGTGRLSDTLREMNPDMVVVEVDILEKGGRLDLLKKGVAFVWMPDC